MPPEGEPDGSNRTPSDEFAAIAAERVVVPITGDTPGDTLRRMRVTAGLSKRQLAKEIGVDEQVIRLWETNRSKPRPSNAKRVAELFECDIFDIWPLDLWE